MRSMATIVARVRADLPITKEESVDLSRHLEQRQRSDAKVKSVISTIVVVVILFTIVLFMAKKLGFSVGV